MKFSTLFSVFLAAVSIGVGASPVAKAEGFGTDLAKRDDVETPAYKAVSQVHSVQPDKYYAFALEWPLGPVGDGDAETSQELTELRQKLGFEHIGLIVGPVTKTTTGKGKNQKTTYDFKGVLYHMIMDSKGKTEPKKANWVPDNKTLKFAKETTKKKSDAISGKAKSYIDDHPTYNVDDNNCDSFVQALLKDL